MKSSATGAPPRARGLTLLPESVGGPRETVWWPQDPDLLLREVASDTFCKLAPVRRAGSTTRLAPVGLGGGPRRGGATRLQRPGSTAPPSVRRPGSFGRSRRGRQLAGGAGAGEVDEGKPALGIRVPASNPSLRLRPVHLSIAYIWTLHFRPVFFFSRFVSLLLRPLVGPLAGARGVRAGAQLFFFFFFCFFFFFFFFFCALE